MARGKPKPKVPLVRTWPLDSELHEAFVREYLDCYDGPQAALRAGFERPLMVWQALLETEDIQARLRGYKVGIDAPAHSASAITHSLLQSIFAPRKPGLVRDIVTGQLRPDWETVEHHDSDFFEYEETVQNKGGIPTRTMRLRKRGTFEAKKMVVQQLEKLVHNSGQSGDRLAHAYLQLTRKGSKAPIAP